MIVELVGVAASGKTTISELLARDNDWISIARPPKFYNPLYFPFFMKQLVDLKKNGFCLSNAPSKCDAKRLIRLLVLNGWHQELRRKHSAGITLLDQGPVFRLARDIESAEASMRSAIPTSWVNELYRTWAATLGGIVWLTVADDVLISRLCNRPKAHAWKHAPAPAVHRRAAAVHAIHNRVISRLCETDSGPALKRFSTDTASLPETLAELRSFLYLWSSAQAHTLDGGKASHPLAQLDSRRACQEYQSHGQ